MLDPVVIVCSQANSSVEFKGIMMLTELTIRIGVSCLLLFTLPIAADELIMRFQIPPMFGAVAAIASFFGACFPILGMLKNSELD